MASNSEASVERYECPGSPARTEGYSCEGMGGRRAQPAQPSYLCTLSGTMICSPQFFLHAARRVAGMRRNARKQKAAVVVGRAER